MKTTLQHRGVVQSVAEGKVTVSVKPESACAGCHAKGICGESGSERLISVNTPYASEYGVGERVVVALLRESMAMSSVIWGYVIPLVVLLVALFGSVAIGFSDGVSALVSLVAVAIYYVGLYIARRVFERKIEFTIFKE
ncbi:MAG: SoxR reducing system RseC family protein [Alistipes sp.]|nr:SoxR reducing system RseC family protein [Alistipes sp.]MBO7263002.1 SoxR reducing system RseC family protein [Alistipes sp.]